MGECIEIEKAENGYIVEVHDPKIVRENQKSGAGWRDPDRYFLFNTWEKVVEFLRKSGDKLFAEGDYDAAFKAMVAEAKDDDEGDDG